MLNTLIVEHNAAYRAALHQLLVDQFPGMVVAEARNRDDALLRALACHFDLVFLDIRQPQGSGLELTRTLRAICSRSVIVVLGPHAIPEYREAALRHGADHFLAWDEFTSVQVLAFVEGWLQQRHVCLIVDDDAVRSAQLAALLARCWPAMAIAEAGDVGTALGKAAASSPDLVLLELGFPCFGVLELAARLRFLSPEATLIGLSPTLPLDAAAGHAGMDYAVPSTPAGHAQLLAIVGSLRPDRTRH